jgi:hypothetical protein
MWIPRTPEEVQKWHAATQREARSQGWLIAGLSWLGITALLAGGWIVGGRAGFITENSVAAGSFWSRFPIFAIAGLPVAYWLYRRESARERESTMQMTICPKCEPRARATLIHLASAGAIMSGRVPCVGLMMSRALQLTHQRNHDNAA